MLQALKVYKELKESIPEMIKVSGYRNEFIAKRMGIKPSHFSVKKQRGSWTDEEIQLLVDALMAANDEVRDFLDIKHIDSYVTGNTLTLDEFKKSIA